MLGRSYFLLAALVLASPSAAAEAEAVDDASAASDSHASAQAADVKQRQSSQGSSDEVPKSPEPSSENPAEIKETYQLGKEAYAQGDYLEARRLFSEVYRRTDHPALLFNMAQANRLAGPAFCLEAHNLYVEYLVRDAEAPNGDEVRERIAELEACASAADERQAAERAEEEARQRPPATAEPSSEPQAVSKAAPVLTITSGAILLVGVGLFTAAKVRYADAQEECPCEPGSLSQWETMEKVGVATMATGAAGVAAGGVWWWASLNPRQGRESVVLGVSGKF